MPKNKKNTTVPTKVPLPTTPVDEEDTDSMPGLSPNPYDLRNNISVPIDPSTPAVPTGSVVPTVDSNMLALILAKLDAQQALLVAHDTKIREIAAIGNSTGQVSTSVTLSQVAPIPVEPVFVPIQQVVNHKRQS